MRSNFEPFVFILPITLFLFAIFPFVSGCSSHEAQGPVVFANGEELHGVWEDVKRAGSRLSRVFLSLRRRWVICVGEPRC